MEKIITGKVLETAISSDSAYSEDESQAVVIRDLEIELGAAAMRVFKGQHNIITVINYIDIECGQVMVSASFHGE